MGVVNYDWLTWKIVALLDGKNSVIYHCVIYCKELVLP